MGACLIKKLSFWCLFLSGVFLFEYIFAEKSQKISAPVISDHALVLRTDAIQRSINIIGEFSFKFSAAVLAPSLKAQRKLVDDLCRTTLASHFSLVLKTGPITFRAHDCAELLCIIRRFGTAYPFYSNFVGNFQVLDYQVGSNNLRKLQIQALNYLVRRGDVDIASLHPSLELYDIVETQPGIFKIKKLVSTATDGITLGL